MSQTLKLQEEGVRGWDGWIASPIQWTPTWANSGRLWGTGRHGAAGHGVTKSWIWHRDWTTTNEFLTMLLLLLVWTFDWKACGILASWPGIEPTAIALEDKVLTTRPTRKSWKTFIKGQTGWGSLSWSIQQTNLWFSLRTLVKPQYSHSTLNHGENSSQLYSSKAAWDQEMRLEQDNAAQQGVGGKSKKRMDEIYTKVSTRVLRVSSEKGSGVYSADSFLWTFSLGTSLVVQGLRLHAPNTGSLGSILGQGTRSHMPQPRVHMPQLKKDLARCNQDPE